MSKADLAWVRKMQQKAERTLAQKAKLAKTNAVKEPKEPDEPVRQYVESILKNDNNNSEKQ